MLSRYLYVHVSLLAKNINISLLSDPYRFCVLIVPYYVQGVLK